MGDDARIAGIDARMAQIAAGRGHWPDERTPKELHAMADAQFVSWACGVIHGAAVMAPMRSNDGRLDDLCQMAYLEAERRHPRAPLYTRAHNRCLREEGYGDMMSEEDWGLPAGAAPAGREGAGR